MGHLSGGESLAKGPAVSETVLERECFPKARARGGGPGTRCRAGGPAVGRVPAAGGWILPGFTQTPHVSGASCTQLDVLGSGLGRDERRCCGSSFWKHP